MNNVLIALMFSAGVAGVAYSKLGRRVGYGNEKSVWTLVVVSFVLSFIVLMIIFSLFLDLNK